MRRRTTVLLSGLVLSTVLAANAAAAPPAELDSYVGGSSAYAVLLDANVIDLSLLASQTVAGVSSTDPTATAGGGALVIGDQVLGGPEDLCPLTLPAPIDSAVASIGCTTVMKESDADPRATSASAEVVLVLGGSELTNQILTPLRDAVISELTPQLDPIFEALGGIGLPEFQALIDAALDTLTDINGETVRISLAPTNSAASADETGVLARSEAAGLIIEVIPAFTGAPPVGITSCADSNALLCAQIAGSVAQVRLDPTTGGATTDATAAQLVDFLVAPQLGTLLGTALPEVAAALNGAVGQLADSSPLACGEPGPLADLICLDAAGTDVLDTDEAAALGFPYGNGTIGARASALRVELLRAAEGGVALALNEAVAAANFGIDAARGELPPVPETITPLSSPTLARTGGGAVSPAAAVLMLGAGLGAAVLVRRSRPSLG